MTEEKKGTRLSKAVREFNVGISTIVEFLHKKGFDFDTDPNTKLSPDAYQLLLKEYSSDLSVKKESEKLSLREITKKKETLTLDDFEEEVEPEGDNTPQTLIKDTTGSTAPLEIKSEVPKQSIKVVGKIDLEPKPKKVKEAEPVAPEPTKEKEAPATPEKPVAEEKPAKKEEPVVAEKPVEEKKAGPKIVGKIDLPGTTKKSKEAAPAEEKKKEEPAAKEQAPEKTVKVAEKVDEPAVIPDEADAPPKIYRAKREELRGPKVVGTIQLPVDDRKKAASSDSADKSNDNRRKKRRKRIQTDTAPAAAKPADTSRPAKPGSRGAKKKPIRHEVNEEDVQKQIKETLARLTTKGKSKGSKYRREKRDLVSQKSKDEFEKLEAEKNILKVTEFVSVNELASMMDQPVTSVISSCMSLGMMVSINQRLDAETMALVAEEFGYKINFVSAELVEAVTEQEDDPEDLTPRPPIVTVMGHVDHGKTKLLDHIRDTNVIAGEAGGITQHIGAYSVSLKDGRLITFLDTPGHEAFTAMRARGAQITDIAIIVVAADDGVMPQTKEAINHAAAAGVPIVFAINKIDKASANPEKIKEALAGMNYLVEDWGGKFQSQEISAKSGLNIDLLLEKVLLEAELLDLKANAKKPAIGSVIESSLDKGRGYVATILVKAGTLKIGDILLAGSTFGHVKAMYNERGKKIDEAGPATPVLILGLNGAPQPGDKFNVMDSDKEAKDIAYKRAQLQREQGLRTQKHITLDEIGRRIAIGNFQELNLIVKGDVDGSVEALSDSLIKLSTEEIQVNIIHKAVGGISESDILLAAASNAIIVGFQVRPSLGARKLAEKEEIDIRLYSIIYNAIEEIKSAMEGMLSPEIKEEIVATLEIRDVFKVTKAGNVAGCFVREGKINRNTRIRLIRDGIVIYTGELGSLKRFKDDVKEVTSGYECGLNIHNFNDIKIGDTIEGYVETEVERTSSNIGKRKGPSYTVLFYFKWNNNNRGVLTL